MFVCVCMHTCAVGTLRSQKKVAYPLELHLQEIESHSAWLLGTKLRSSTRNYVLLTAGPSLSAPDSVFLRSDRRERRLPLSLSAQILFISPHIYLLYFVCVSIWPACMYVHPRRGLPTLAQIEWGLKCEDFLWLAWIGECIYPVLPPLLPSSPNTEPVFLNLHHGLQNSGSLGIL